MQEINVDHAKSILIAFISDMNAWEIKYYPLFCESIIKYENIATKELLEIYNKYLTQKDRKYGREHNLACRIPPEYDTDTESIESTEEIGKNKYVIYTLSTQMKEYVVKYRYTLKFIKQEWRIDKKEIFDIFKDKWVSQIF